MSVIKKNVEPFLKSLGFSGLDNQYTLGDVAAYSYKDFNFDVLESELGSVTLVSGDDFIYKIANKGSVVVNHPERLVTLLNSAKIFKEIKDAKSLSTHLRLPDSLYQKFLDARDLRGDAKISMCQQIWQFFNKTKFKGQLRLPNFDIQPSAGLDTRTRAFWMPSERLISVTESTFYAPVSITAETFLHEMCHQAVSEIDMLPIDDGFEGHGQPWIRWMKRVGLPPERYSINDKVHFLNTEEKDRLTEIQDKAVPPNYEKSTIDSVVTPGINPIILVSANHKQPLFCLSLYPKVGDRLRIFTPTSVDAKKGYLIDSSDLFLKPLAADMTQKYMIALFYRQAKLSNYSPVEVRKYLTQAVQRAAYEDGMQDNVTYYLDWIQNDFR